MLALYDTTSNCGTNSDLIRGQKNMWTARMWISQLASCTKGGIIGYAKDRLKRLSDIMELILKKEIMQQSGRKYSVPLKGLVSVFYGRDFEAQ